MTLYVIWCTIFNVIKLIHDYTITEQWNCRLQFTYTKKPGRITIWKWWSLKDCRSKVMDIFLRSIWIRITFRYLQWPSKRTHTANNVYQMLIHAPFSTILIIIFFHSGNKLTKWLNICHYQVAFCPLLYVWSHILCMYYNYTIGMVLIYLSIVL